MDDLFKMYEEPELEQHSRCHTASRCAGRMQMSAQPSLNHHNFTMGRIYFHLSFFFPSTLCADYTHNKKHNFCVCVWLLLQTDCYCVCVCHSSDD